MEELIKAMSNEDLAELKAKYTDNPSVATLIDGILETRGKEAEQAKAKTQFTNGIAKLFAKLPHPDNVYNVYARWAEVEVEDAAGEPVELSEEVCKANDLEVGTMRVPTHKEHQWVVEVNYALRVTSSSANGRPTSSKRAITVFKRNGTQLEEKGHYASASKACEVLGLTIGSDSATRVLTRDGFISEPYDGTDYGEASQRD